MISTNVFNRSSLPGLAVAIVLASLTPAAATPIVYMIDNGSTTSFGTADLGTDTYTSIDASLTNQLVGLASANGALYGAGSSQILYRINTSTGALTAIGSSGFTYVDIGSTLNGLYGMDASGNLYSIDPNSGAGTLLGSTGLTLGQNFSLSNGSSTLFFALGSNSDLYTLSTTNGAPTLLGSMGTAVRLGQAVGISLSALDLAGGTLYGSESFPGSNTVYTMNTTNGLGTAVGPISGAPGQFATGWAQIVGTNSSSTPEPASSALLTLGLTVVLKLRKRRTGCSRGPAF